jgi:hypothetical protein
MFSVLGSPESSGQKCFSGPMFRITSDRRMSLSPCTFSFALPPPPQAKETHCTAVAETWGLQHIHITSIFYLCCNVKKKLHGLSPRANYTDRATAACRRSDCQLPWIEGATWSA